MKGNLDISSKIIEAVSAHRKMSERIVGYVSHDLKFQYLTYKGTSQKPERISVLEKTIVRLIGRGVGKIYKIAEILGFDYYHNDVESSLLKDSINYLKTNLQLVKGGSQDLSLTTDGYNFIRTGTISRTFTSPFKIGYAPGNKNFTILDSCIKGEFEGTIAKNPTNPLTLAELQRFAESQASNMQDSKQGITLQSATLKELLNVKYPLYVCFVQSIRDNSIRTIIYDEHVNKVIPELSELFNEKSYIDSLLPKCLKNEIKSQTLEETESGEKSEEQVKSEQRIIELEDKLKNAVEEETAELIVGSSFNTPEFENQLAKIFDSHNNEEIWLISPWIKQYAFLNAREPKIRKFLDLGGAIFVGYSKPAREGEEMVDSLSLVTLKRLDANYDKFYFAELPEFHIKNVIEYKKNDTTLYSGSFNVLSFCINNKTSHYRQEEMTVVNQETARRKREEYLSMFAEKYIAEYSKKVEKTGSGRQINVSKLDYLNNLGIAQDSFTKLVSEATSASVNLVKAAKFTPEENVEISKKILSSTGNIEDEYYVQAILAACQYLYDYYVKNKNQSRADDVINLLSIRLLGLNSFYEGNTCRFVMRKGKENEKKTILYIICNGLYFEFSEISLGNQVFKNVQRRKEKERISFKDENIQSVRWNGNNERILYNSAKILDLI